MQRRYSETNTYIDTVPSISQDSNELYDDVASIADPEVGMGVKIPSGICAILSFIWIAGCFPPLTSSSQIIQDAEEDSEPNCEENKVQEVIETTKEHADAEQDSSKIYLDLVPLPSFLHPMGGHKTSPHKETSSASTVHVEEHRDHLSPNKEVEHQIFYHDPCDLDNDLKHFRWQ